MDLDADLYSDFHTYAALWTPEHISFYFGKDRSSLDLIYRTTTPQDAMSPMYLIANDHFTARGGWWEPDPGALDQTLAELRQKNGDKRPNIVYILLDDMGFKSEPGTSVCPQ